MNKLSSYLQLDSYDSTSRRILWILFLLLITFNIFSTAAGQFLVSLTIIFSFALIIFKKNFSFLKNTLVYLYSLFAVLSLISVFLSVDFTASSKNIPFIIIFNFSFIACLYAINNLNSEKLNLIFSFLFTTALIASIYGSLSFFLEWSERAQSTTSGYYTLGIYLTSVLSLGLFSAKNEKIFPKKIYWYIFIIIIFAGIFFTLNRVHWVAAGILILICGIMKERFLLLLLIIVSVLALIFVPEVNERFSMLLNITEFTSDRNFLWQGFIQLMGQRPVTGFGPNTFSIIFPLKNEIVDKSINSWHNDFVQIYMERGIFALLIYVSIYVFVCINFLKYIRDKKILQNYKYVLTGIFLALSVFFFAGGSFDPIGNITYSVILSIFILYTKPNSFT
ncbi:MAG TPA: O-antigen ligase family protein [Ignavibacteria bacterium]|nr:O-antigen ligase family protein [Ignavibacteria bacterium]